MRNAEESQKERRGNGDGEGGSKDGGDWDASTAAGGACSGSAAGRGILGKAKGCERTGGEVTRRPYEAAASTPNCGV